MLDESESNAMISFFMELGDMLAFEGFNRNDPKLQSIVIPYDIRQQMVNGVYH